MSTATDLNDAEQLTGDEGDVTSETPAVAPAAPTSEPDQADTKTAGDEPAVENSERQGR